MALFHSPKIVKDNLVFAYDMNNKKSYIGEPATNLVTYPLNLYTGSAFNTAYLYDQTTSHTFTYKTGVSNPVNAPGILEYYTGSTGYKYWSSRTTGLASGTYTFSYYARVVGGTGSISNNQLWRDSNTTDRTPSGDWNPTYSANWTRYSSTSTISDGDFLDYFLIHGNSIVGGVTIQFCGFQLELRSYSTPFVNGTRSTTQALLDQTKKNTLIPVSLTYATDNTFSFNGTSSYIDNSSAIVGLGSSSISHTFDTWVYPTGTTGNIISMSAQRPSGGWNMPPLAASGQQFKGQVWNNNILTSSTYTLNTWYNVVLVFDYAAGGQYLYVNGVLVDSQTAITYTSSGASGNYIFIGEENPGAGSYGYWPGKIASVKIYSGKALSASEVSQNFNALRGRFGL
jgi:hypothetical protein